MNDYKIQMHAPYELSSDFGKEALKLNTTPPNFDITARTKVNVDKVIDKIISFFCGGDEILKENVTVKCYLGKKWDVCFKDLLIGNVEINHTIRGIELEGKQSKESYLELKERGAAL